MLKLNDAKLKLHTSKEGNQASQLYALPSNPKKTLLNLKKRRNQASQLYALNAPNAEKTILHTTKKFNNYFLKV